jgi:hypothetical protein
MPTIPVNLFQSWTTKTLPPRMAECVASLKRDNPEFAHHLYDDDDCERFIEEHFHPEVVDAFRTLIPGAFKADLWRYCVLFIHGGIYLDIKFRCINGFRLVQMTDREYFCNTLSPHGVYTAIMVCLPGNPVLKRCIHQIVHHVRTEFYGSSCFDITGPQLVSRCLRPEDKNTDLTFTETKTDENAVVVFQKTYERYRYIVFKGQYALEQYPEYERAIQLPYYGDLYDARHIYRPRKNEEAWVIGPTYYEALKYHMEEALAEQGRDTSHVTNSPPSPSFPTPTTKSCKLWTTHHATTFVSSGPCRRTRPGGNGSWSLPRNTLRKGPSLSTRTQTPAGSL